MMVTALLAQNLFYTGIHFLSHACFPIVTYIFVIPSSDFIK
jgi:hypothetical protein